MQGKRQFGSKVTVETTGDQMKKNTYKVYLPNP